MSVLQNLFPDCLWGLGSFHPCTLQVHQGQACAIPWVCALHRSRALAAGTGDGYRCTWAAWGQADAPSTQPRGVPGPVLGRGVTSVLQSPHLQGADQAECGRLGTSRLWPGGFLPRRSRENPGCA